MRMLSQRSSAQQTNASGGMGSSERLTISRASTCRRRPTNLWFWPANNWLFAFLSICLNNSSPSYIRSVSAWSSSLALLCLAQSATWPLGMLRLGWAVPRETKAQWLSASRECNMRNFKISLLFKPKCHFHLLCLLSFCCRPK